MKRLPGLVVFALCAMAAGGGAALAATCSPTLFIQAAEYPTGGSAADVAVADFDGDGFPDVVVAHGNDGTISVLLNAGDGTLGPPIVTSVGQTAQAVAAADLRGNGTMDAIVATYSEIFVLLGHGDGTFDAPVPYPSGVGNIRALLVDKFDANGTWDVVVASQYDDHLSFLPGNGNGTLGAPIETGFVTAINGLAAGDFDQDGHLDLIGSVRDSGFVFYLRGVGDGSFEAPTFFVAGTGLAGLTASDVNGDAMLDIAVVSDTAVSVLLGNGDGGFQAALQYP
jgi:hypothetical protein